MLNKNDIELVEKAVVKGFRDQDSSNAWERIKKELSGSGQNSAELRKAIKFFDPFIKEVMGSHSNKMWQIVLNSLPSGKTNTPKPKTTKEAHMYCENCNTHWRAEIPVCPECDTLGCIGRL